MTDTITILGIAGSLRQNSFNAALLRAAAAGAPPGGTGTAHAQTAWLPVLRALGMQPWFGTLLYVSSAHKVFDASGTLLDAQIRERLRIYMTGFVAFVQRRS